MKRKLTTKMLVVLLVCVMALFAACNNNSATTDQQTAEQPTQAAKTDEAQETQMSNFNETGLPIVNETVTFRVLTANSATGPSDFNDLAIMQSVEADTNVHIDWIMSGSGYDEKRALMLSSGDLPDFMTRSVTATELVKYGADGTFIPMQDLIDEYAPNIVAIMDETPGLRAYVTAPDGNIYGVPRVLSGPWTAANGVGVINQQWLDTLGLPMPTNTTEFFDTMLKFKTMDPNGNGVQDELPITFGTWAAGQNISGVLGFSYIMSSFGIPLSSNYADVVDGEVVLLATLPGYKDAVKYLGEMYSNDLIDQEGFTMTRQQMDAKISQDPFTAGYVQIWDIADDFSVAAALDDYTYMPPLDGPNGETAQTYIAPLYGVSRGAGVITKACEYPEAAMRWIDYIYDQKVSMQICEGPIGTRITDNGDGTYEIAPPPEGKTATQWKDENAMGGYGFFAITSDTFSNVFRIPTTDNKVAFMNEEMIPISDTEPFPGVYYTLEEAEEMSLLQSDITSYVERKTSEWIMNGTIDDEWDDFLQELNNRGLDKWLEINQAAYDRFVK